MGCVSSKRKPKANQKAIFLFQDELDFLHRLSKDNPQHSQLVYEEICKAIRDIVIINGRSPKSFDLHFSGSFWRRDEQESNTMIEKILNRIWKLHSDLREIQGINNQLVTLTLRHLDESVTEELLAKFQTPFPHLKRIDFSFNKCVTDEVMEAVFQNCTNLNDVYMEHCSPLTADGFKFVYLLKDLKVFLFGDCDVDGDRLISHIEKCKSLTFLHISGVSGLTRNALIQCVTQLPLLKSLQIQRIYERPRNPLKRRNKKNDVMKNMDVVAF